MGWIKWAAGAAVVVGLYATGTAGAVYRTAFPEKITRPEEIYPVHSCSVFEDPVLRIGFDDRTEVFEVDNSNHDHVFSGVENKRRLFVTIKEDGTGKTYTLFFKDGAAKRQYEERALNYLKTNPSFSQDELRVRVNWREALAQRHVLSPYDYPIGQGKVDFNGKEIDVIEIREPDVVSLEYDATIRSQEDVPIVLDPQDQAAGHFADTSRRSRLSVDERRRRITAETRDLFGDLRDSTVDGMNSDVDAAADKAVQDVRDHAQGIEDALNKKR